LQFRPPIRRFVFLVHRFVELHQAFESFANKPFDLQRADSLAFRQLLAVLPEQLLGRGLVAAGDELSRQIVNAIVRERVVSRLDALTDL
jgi:hypothetical protein